MAYQLSPKYQLSSERFPKLNLLSRCQELKRTRDEKKLWLCEDYQIRNRFFSSCLQFDDGRLTSSRNDQVPISHIKVTAYKDEIVNH